MQSHSVETPQPSLPWQVCYTEKQQHKLSNSTHNLTTFSLLLSTGSIAGAFFGTKELPTYLVEMCEAYKDSKKYAKKLFEINQQDQSSSQASDNVTTMPPITLSLNGTGLAIMKSQVNEPILVGSSAVRNNSDVFSTKSLNFACSNGIC